MSTLVLPFRELIYCIFLEVFSDHLPWKPLVIFHFGILLHISVPKCSIIVLIIVQLLHLLYHVKQLMFLTL